MENWKALIELPTKDSWWQLSDGPLVSPGYEDDDGSSKAPAESPARQVQLAILQHIHHPAGYQWGCGSPSATGFEPMFSLTFWAVNSIWAL